MEKMISRKETVKIKIGNTFIGGNSDIAIQSMTNTDTRDIKNTVYQIQRLEEAGCDIIRVAVPDEESADAIKVIKAKIKIPIIADIHFDYKLAIKSIENGADKIRINPGNIGNVEKVSRIVDAAKNRNVPIRIGVNSGSLEKNILVKHGKATPEAMVESALYHVNNFEKMGFENIVLSVKASSVQVTILANRLLSEKTKYPIHIGVTEAGTVYKGTIKSAIGLGNLLFDGIGDTIRVSLSTDPVEEVLAGKEILKTLGLRKQGIEIISCPTCARCKINIIKTAQTLEKELEFVKCNLKVAVMGCTVNGPGEAKEADIGITGGDGEALLFKKGKIIRKIPEDEIIKELVGEIIQMTGEER